MKEKTKQAWLEQFLKFLDFLKIDSKEISGACNLRDNIYGAQVRFLEEICDGLGVGVRHFCILKARQLGISTISLAMDLFWLLVHDGLQGALVTDTDGNRDKFRLIIDRYFQSLPKALLGNIHIVKHNRNNLVLSNGSVLDYLVAGVKKGNTNLGRSRALNFVHATECSAYGDAEGIASLMAAMAQKHPDRLYIFESTAKGFNSFWEMCEAAKKDSHTQKFIFIGWWAKEDYSIPKDDPRFKEYFDGSYTDEEFDMIKKVKESYGHQITDEQIAWYRWYGETRSSAEGMLQQEMPSTEEEAFISSGQSFFPKTKIAKDMRELLEAKVLFRAYRYHMGRDFIATEIESVQNSFEADLKVWHEPSANGVYVIGCDPAYGRNDNKDRHSMEVWRCYADRMVQVAEYASPNPETYQAAWVLAHLAGYYKNCILNIEVQGPGQAVMREFQTLRQQLDSGYLAKQNNLSGIKDIFGAVNWYLYNRYDTYGQSNAINWITNASNKLAIMNQMRDMYSINHLTINSVMLYEEMHRIVQDGGSIEADGRGKDDRVVATALAIRAWIDRIRPGMIAQHETYERVTLEEVKENDSSHHTLMGSVMKSFYAQQENNRARAHIASRRKRR